MAQFDIKAARAEGYTDAEIADYLAETEKFDVNAARTEGYNDAEIIDHLANAAPVVAPVAPEPDNSMAQWAGVGARALAPYATAAGLGAAAGAPFAGVGAPIGAAGGVLSLGLGDLATSGYNAVAPVFGGKTVPLPSESIQNALGNVGVGRAPQTGAQRIFGAGLQAAAGGGAQAMGARGVMPLVQGDVGRGVVNALAAQPRAQAIGGAGAGVAGQAAAEAGYGPVGQFLASLAGGTAAGGVALPKRGARAPSAADLRQTADNAYAAARDAGVVFNPKSAANLQQSVSADLSGFPDIQYHPKLHPRISVVLDDLNDIVTSNEPVPFQRLEQLRRLTRTAGKSIDADERRLAGLLRDKIDEFVQGAGAGDVQAGDIGAAQPAITKAREAWSRMSKSNEVEDLIDRASRMKSNPADAIKSQFTTLANNKNRMRMFSKDEQRMIRRIADGTSGSKTLELIGKLAPGVTSMRGGMASAANILAGAAVNPILGGGMALAGGGSRLAANRLAAGRAEQAGAFMRGGAEGMKKAPSQMPSLIAPVGAQAVNQMSRGGGSWVFDPATNTAMWEDAKGNLYPTKPF
jgi:hypothetical protein